MGRAIAMTEDQNYSFMNHKGFTILELITVILIIGIITAIVIPRMINTATISAQEAAKMVAADIRTTQMMALGDNTKTYSIEFTLGSGSYTIYKSFPTVFRTTTLPSGVTISTSTTITYDTYGQATGTPTLIISVGGTAIVTVTHSTGKVNIT